MSAQEIIESGGGTELLPANVYRRVLAPAAIEAIRALSRSSINR